MAIWRFEDKTPLIGKGTYIADSAEIIGNVKIGENCYIGPGAKIRGDYGRVEMGNGCSIQENVVIHARPDGITIIGNDVTVGHKALIHNATINDYAVVGMGSIVSDFVVMEEWSILGEGALAKKNFKFNKGEIGVGVPCKIIGNILDKPAAKQELLNYKDKYREMARRHLVPGALERLE
jgi:carbonic anhydrase/acetyltransferase-like protein (isoleucine patch superfamily)